jgi:uncharacterized protein (TIGR02453 family)
MSTPRIPASALEFIKQLSKNNTRDWFNKHKDRYLQEQEKMLVFADALLNEMQRHDELVNTSGKDVLFRIYRDTRFSKDKTPYKDHWAGRFKRATKQLRGGYYFEIKPGGHSLMAGGFFAPNAPDLLRIRQDIDYNHADWQKLLKSKTIAGTFGSLRGDTIATAPRGFDKDHPGIALLRHKQFYLRKGFTDAEVLAPGFLKQLNQTFKNLRPYFNYMSEVLTTDLNGESVL